MTNDVKELMDEGMAILNMIKDFNEHGGHFTVNGQDAERNLKLSVEFNGCISIDTDY